MEMKLEPMVPPRAFHVGVRRDIEIQDCGKIVLEHDEQVTFTTPAGGEYDVLRKQWGFYATPSLNGRLVAHGLRGVLMKNKEGRFYVLLVEAGCEDEFTRYIEEELQTVVLWLDDDLGLHKLVDLLSRD